MNPHEQYLTDEASGHRYFNQRFIDWQEGWHAGIKATQEAINRQGGYIENLGKPKYRRVK